MKAKMRNNKAPRKEDYKTTLQLSIKYNNI